MDPDQLINELLVGATLVGFRYDVSGFSVSFEAGNKAGGGGPVVLEIACEVRVDSAEGAPSDLEQDLALTALLVELRYRAPTVTGVSLGGGEVRVDFGGRWFRAVASDPTIEQSWAVVAGRPGAVSRAVGVSFGKIQVESRRAGGFR